MLEKIANKLTRKPKLVILIATLLLIPSILGAALTRINYDILSYLPQDLDSAKGEALLEEPFHMAATTMLIVEDMPPEYTNRLLEQVKEVPGVSGALWVSDLIGIQFPQEMLPQDLRDVFFSDHATMLIVQYEQPGASETTMKAIDEVRKLCNQNCFLAGFSVFIKDTKDLITKEMPLYVLMAGILSAIAMCVIMYSWLLPVALLLSIGLAVIYNFGTNIFLGQISFITQAVAAVLQLGVTMDYSIFLFDRYMEELPHYDDKRDAMASAVVAAFKSVSGSSLTTVAGFLALCFMRLTLGRDIGIVMAKGVVLGVATVILVLPSILLQMDKGIQKFHHKCLKPDMAGVNAFIVRHRKGFVILFALLFVPAVYANNHTQVYYKLDESLPQDMPSIVSNNKLKNDFNMASTYFIVMEDGLGHGEMAEMEEAIESIPGITSVAAYDKFLPAGIPDFFIPDAIKDICKKDGYQMLMVNSGYVTASDEVALQLEQLNALVKSYDRAGHDRRFDHHRRRGLSGDQLSVHHRHPHFGGHHLQIPLHPHFAGGHHRTGHLHQSGHPLLFRYGHRLCGPHRHQLCSVGGHGGLCHTDDHPVSGGAAKRPRPTGGHSAGGQLFGYLHPDLRTGLLLRHHRRGRRIHHGHCEGYLHDALPGRRHLRLCQHLHPALGAGRL